MLYSVLCVLIVRLKHAFLACLNSAFKDLKTTLLSVLKSPDNNLFRCIEKPEGSGRNRHYPPADLAGYADSLNLAE